MNIEIRKETERDYFETEKMVRESFFNKYQPGCNEHYMVHVMRSHETFLPELSRIAVVDGKIAGVIMYFESKIKKADGGEVKIASFGPLGVSREYRTLGIGKKLMAETLPLAKAAGYPGVLIIGEPEYYPKVGFIRCKECGITDAEGNAWDPYMVYEFEKGSMHIPGIMEEPYDITDGIPPVPPSDYENQFEKWNRASLPCQFAYPNPSDENNGYHLKREEEKPSEFDAFFAKLENENGVRGETIRKCRTNHGFIIGNGNRGVGMCVISSAAEKPVLTHIWLEEEFRGKGIEENIKKTLENQNM